jgi:hypothetical protein
MNLASSGLKLWVVLLVVIVVLGLFASRAADVLVVDSPRPSDVILVLAGETEKRPEKAVELLDQGYGHKIVMDVPMNSEIYRVTVLQLAQNYVKRLPEASAISICPIVGLSTKAESKEAERCMAGMGARTVLIVTADFHTRRAAQIFRKEVPEYQYSTAAVTNNEEFGGRWWTHRQWAKTLVDEWMRVIWWSCVDRWF